MQSAVMSELWLQGHARGAITVWCVHERLDVLESSESIHGDVQSAG